MNKSRLIHRKQRRNNTYTLLVSFILITCHGLKENEKSNNHLIDLMDNDYLMILFIWMYLFSFNSLGCLYQTFKPNGGD